MIVVCGCKTAKLVSQSQTSVRADVVRATQGNLPLRSLGFEFREAPRNGGTNSRQYPVCPKCGLEARVVR